MSHERPVAAQPRPRRRGCALWWLLPLLLVLFPVLNRCSLFRPRGVSVLVSEPKDNSIQIMVLAPDGKHLFYRLLYGYRLLNLVTGETYNLPLECNRPMWLDNQTLFCRSSEPPHALMDVHDYSTTTIPAVDARKQDIASLLRRVGQQVYELDEYPDPRVYLLRAAQSAESVYLFNVAEDLQSTQLPPVMFMPARRKLDVRNEPVISPDGKYYYIHGSFTYLRLYRRVDDLLLREVPFNSAGAVVTGWMYDSSGVIYHTKRGAISFSTHPIYKLNVPRAGWRWPWE